MNEQTVERFSEEVAERIGNYVYRLIDPTNGETFYVGKGRGNRVFDHINNRIAISDEDAADPKTEQIIKIQKAGLRVIHVIHRHNIPPHAVLEVEAALIDAFPGLKNIQGGTGSADYGPMNVAQLETLYGLRQFDLRTDVPMMFININQTSERDSYMTQTQFAWRVSPARATKARYVCAVVRGVIKEVFEQCTWLPATPENFPDFRKLFEIDDDKLDDRYGFHGRVSETDYARSLINLRLPDTIRHQRNPIRYFKCD